MRLTAPIIGATYNDGVMTLRLAGDAEVAARWNIMSNQAFLKGDGRPPLAVLSVLPPKKIKQVLKKRKRNRKGGK